ncbi:MAG TPA: major capsid protein [Bryobacteraceae bacterium]|jgi:hypothetical protein
MNILDVFNQDAFGARALTRVVNDITPQYGRLGAMGIFRDEGVDQRLVAVDFDPVTNQLLPQSQWGGPGVANKTAGARARSYSLPTFKVNDSVLAGDIQGRRQPGLDTTQSMQWLLGKKMREMRAKLEQTQEWMRLGVLKSGQVKDGAGNLILDIYADFGISQDSTSFVLGTAGTDVMGKIAGVKRSILANLRGELMSGFVGICSDGFYDAFVSHANVKVAFTYFQNNNGQNLAGDYSGTTEQPNAAGMTNGGIRGFIFGGVTWVNYTGSVTDSASASQPLVDANSAYVLPTGTDVFRTWYAPADYMETVNTEGLAFYAKQEPMRFDRGIEVECQSNPLMMCLKPKVIQKVTVS